MPRRLVPLLEFSFFSVAAVGIWSVGARTEGYFFPVVSETRIERIEDAGNGWSRIWGSFEKNRECSFEELDIRLRGEVRVDYRFEEGSKFRHSGRDVFGPWLVQSTADQLSDRIQMRVFHRCHWLWDTESRFYP